jgi:Ser/Thr protein kinase RdoA (MazF antagonist)
VIHGDFGRGAVILGGGRDGLPRDGLAGFARARYDLRVLDLAAALRTFARVPSGFDLERCAALVAAYDEIDRLSPGEVEALPRILRLERLSRVFRLTSRLEEGSPESVIRELVRVVNNEAVHLRWLEAHEGALIDALGSALVA